MGNRRSTSLVAALVVGVLAVGAGCTDSSTDGSGKGSAGETTWSVKTRDTPPPEARTGDEVCEALSQDDVTELIGHPVESIESFNRGCRYSYPTPDGVAVVSVLGVSGGTMPTEAAFPALLANYREFNPGEEQKPLDIGVEAVEFTSSNGRGLLVLTDSELMFEVRVPESSAGALEPLTEAVVSKLG